jgi:tRNA A37 threonylcarbamoyladenosine biosynthesis protein TsaE
VEQLDLDGYLDRKGILLIEWAKIADPLLPEKRFSVYMDHMTENGKWITDHRKIKIKGPRALEPLRSFAYDHSGY